MQFNGNKITSMLIKLETDVPKTVILTDEEGNEIPAVLTERETVFTATANDIRAGKVAVTDEGITTGEKVIPPYYCVEGYKLITYGSKFEITNIADFDLYDFTKMQAIICLYEKSISDSVKAERVVFDEKVYNANTTNAVSTVTRNSGNKTINLGITNDSANSYIIRYFVYKEIE